uniref:Putative secreted protein n=1 Tax=Ixodes ricinus TaxID=34613 RepID=A0A6B0USQ5_IXORI
MQAPACIRRTLVGLALSIGSTVSTSEGSRSTALGARRTTPASTTGSTQAGSRASSSRRGRTSFPDTFSTLPKSTNRTCTWRASWSADRTLARYHSLSAEYSASTHWDGDGSLVMTVAGRSPSDARARARASLRAIGST